jgi:hypothetical protein
VYNRLVYYAVYWALLLTVMPMLHGSDLTIDHVTVAGTDLKKMQASLAGMGIRSEYGGPHSNHATEMAQTSFPDGSYLELIAIQPNADAKAVAAHYWSKWMEANAGPCAWAVRSADIAAEVRRLQAAHTEVSSPARSGRERPDGTRLNWEAAPVGRGPNGSFFPFLIHDFTPREQRAFPTGAPVTKDFSGIAKVVIAVHDVKASSARYQQAYGLPAPTQETDGAFGARLSIFAGTPVVFAEPIDAKSWLTERLARIGEGPCAFVLGAHKDGVYKTVSSSRWMDAEISWFDAAKLGWHLGFLAGR